MDEIRAPKIAIRTDASSRIGLGHVRRCLSLADALTAKGAQVDFYLFGDKFGEGFVKRAGYPVTNIGWPFALPEAKDLEKADGIIVDSYAMQENDFRRLAAQVPAVLAIDDQALHPLPVDIVVNQNASAKEFTYQTRSDTVQMLGPDYVLLDRSFAFHSADQQPTETRVLVMMGGSDLHQQTEKVLAALSSLPPTFYVDVIIGAGAKSIEDVKKAAVMMPMVTYVHVDPRDIPAIMSRATVAICAGGVTALELAYLGIPAMVITVADNQKEGAKALYDQGAILDLGSYDQVPSHRISHFLRGLLNNPSMRETMSRAGKSLIDGKGADRVAETFLKRIQKRTGLQLMSRPATQPAEPQIVDIRGI
jgi:UDP-2,4-diacetamido-2,4,6-trideoxy-beta-L-altropyranose hydrolase